MAVRWSSLSWGGGGFSPSLSFALTHKGIRAQRPSPYAILGFYIQLSSLCCPVLGYSAHSQQKKKTARVPTPSLALPCLCLGLGLGEGEASERARVRARVAKMPLDFILGQIQPQMWESDTEDAVWDKRDRRGCFQSDLEQRNIFPRKSRFLGPKWPKMVTKWPKRGSIGGPRGSILGF